MVLSLRINLRRSGGYQVDGAVVAAIIDELPASPVVVGSLVDDMASFSAIQRG